MTLRVLHQPVNIGNQARILSVYERAKDVESRLVVKSETWLRYHADETLTKPNEMPWRSRLRILSRGLCAPFAYDIIHAYFGQSLLMRPNRPSLGYLDFLDLRLAKALGKKVFHTFQGCDARIAQNSDHRNESTPCHNGHCSQFQDCVSWVDARRKAVIAMISALSDRIFYLNPELGHELPSSAIFTPYSSVDIFRIEPSAPKPDKHKPIILHAPTDPSTKGSKKIIEAMETLKQRHDIDFRLVQNLPHGDAMALYRQADLIIDQILYGWYGGFAVEAMAMGKPVACAIRESDLQFVPKPLLEDLPILTIDPTRLTASLDEILNRRNEWQQIGNAGRRFVERWHNPQWLAKLMLDCYRDPESRYRLSPAPSAGEA